MTYNVFNGTLNPTQSVLALKKTLRQLMIYLRLDDKLQTHRTVREI